ncbi:MAG: hypothetical protein GY847_09155 [Proteobacteria bacterium]|nr:hypothetical protein [Pseudomonadota bacterium]
MKNEYTNRLAMFFRYALLAGALLSIACYLIIALFRVQYPFQLEWLEGGVVDHVRRILIGQKLYVEPSLDFVPFIYTPLYYYLSAAVSLIIGVGFTPLRGVSICASIGCFVLIFLTVRKDTKETLPGVVAAGLYAANFRTGGAWFDLARVDSLFVLFLLISVYMIKFRITFKSYLLAGILMALAFLTKQAALVAAVPLMCLCFVQNRRIAFIFVAVTALIVGASTLLLDFVHDGWYSYYVFYLPKAHAIEKRMFLDFWVKNLFWPMPIASVLALIYLATHLKGSKKKTGLSYGFMFVAFVGTSWFSSLHSGSYDNVFLPAYAAISILFGLATHSIFQFIRTLRVDRQALLEICICLICMLQFALLVYNPLSQIPTGEDSKAGAEFVDELSLIEGDILIPRHGYLSQKIGKRNFAHEMAMSDVLRGDKEGGGVKLQREILQAVQKRQLGAIVVDYDWLKIDIERDYVKLQKNLFGKENVFLPVTGVRTRPKYIYIPKN